MKNPVGEAFSPDSAPIFIIAALTALFTIYVRVRLLNVPLERDEGEFAYFAQLMLHGIPPYLKAYTLKLPGAAVMYALAMAVFGQSAVAIHLCLLIVNLLAAVMLFFIARRLFDPAAAAAAASSYLLLTLGQGVLGVFAHATHFVVLFALAGFLLLFRALESGRAVTLFSSGLFFGAAIAMKQHGVLFALFALVYFLREQKERLPGDWPRVARRALLFVAGVVAPYAVCGLLLAVFGVFDRFWFWTVDYARQYVSRVTLENGAKSFLMQFAKVSRNAVLLWVAAGVGTLLLFAGSWGKRGRGFLAGLLLFSFLAVCPGLFFRAHYFVMLLPAVALLIGALVGSSADVLPRLLPGRLARIVPAFLFFAIVAISVYRERAYFFALDPVAVSKLLYGANPFPESPQVARYIRDHSSPQDTIAVLGSEPQIYFYADRVSATGHIYMYGLMENQKYAPLMQEELIREIEVAKPLFIVVVNSWFSWLNTPQSPTLILDWSKGYLAENYQLVGIVDIYNEITVYRWDSEAAGYTPQSNAFLAIYRRKGR